jgi:hypothetical protein
MEQINSIKTKEPKGLESEFVTEINKLRDEVSSLNEKVKSLETLLIKISATAERTDSHIDFITNTYETFKAPLMYVKNTVDRLSGITFNRNSAITDSSKIE